MLHYLTVSVINATIIIKHPFVTLKGALRGGGGGG